MTSKAVKKEWIQTISSRNRSSSVKDFFYKKGIVAAAHTDERRHFCHGEWREAAEEEASFQP